MTSAGKELRGRRAIGLNGRLETELNVQMCAHIEGGRSKFKRSHAAGHRPPIDTVVQVGDIN